MFQQWDPELARVAQKWADQCAQVDYKEDLTRKDPILTHDKHADRKIGNINFSQTFLGIKLHSSTIADDSLISHFYSRQNVQTNVHSEKPRCRF